MNCLSFIIIHQIQHSRPRKAWDIIYNSDIFLPLSFFLSQFKGITNACSILGLNLVCLLLLLFQKQQNLNLLWLRLDGELLSLGKYNTQETRKISPSPNLKFRWISDRYIKREKRKKNVLARTIFFWPHSTKNGAERFDICCNKQDKEICVVPLLFIQQRTTQKMYQSMYICIFKHTQSTHVKKYEKRKKCL